jgi:hypothetical protein
MVLSRWDIRWKLWTWQRFQHLVGAALIAVPAGYFLLCLAKGELPADFQSDISIDKEDHRIIDHTNIGYAIGSCHLSGNFSTWPADWLRTLRITSLNFDEPSATPASVQTDARRHEQELTAFEQAALWQSSRIIKERERFLHEAEERQNRARLNQLRILCLSAAAAFLVALKALTASKDEDAPFRSLTKGAMLPISILALLMPVLATAVSGIATFDGDPNIIVRHVRTLAQLEQLHGRIAEDVTSDPYLCPIVRATNTLYRAPASQNDRGLAVDPARLNECLMDRMARTVAWEQRHEQILNEATPTLAHAGDLPRTTDKPQQAMLPAESSRHPSGDVCQAAFTQAIDLAPTGERPAKDAMNTIRRSDTGPL